MQYNENRQQRRFLTCCSSSRVVYGHLVKGAEERDGDVCQGQVQEEVVGHGSHPCINNLSTCQHVNMLICQLVNISTCQFVNMSTCQNVNAGESYSQ